MPFGSPNPSDRQYQVNISLDSNLNFIMVAELNQGIGTDDWDDARSLVQQVVDAVSAIEGVSVSFATEVTRYTEEVTATS